MSVRRVVFLVCVVAAGFALVAGGTPRRVTADTGGRGFYDPPSPLPDGPPGSLIRVEPFPYAPNGARAWRVLYRSTGLEGAPIAVSGVIYAPAGTAPPGGRPVVAWAHPTTGIARSCAPSQLPWLLESRIAGLTDFLARGYVVAATDYPGLGTPGLHPYLVGESEGRAVLDSVRAAADLADAGASRSAAVWGHSQGGHAALFAGQIAPRYAPDLTLVGIAAAAPPTDLAQLFAFSIESTIGRVLASFSFISWSDVYPGADFRALVTPTAVPLMETVARTCVRTMPGLLRAAAPAYRMGPNFLTALPQVTQPWQRLFALNSPGAARLTVPTLVVQGLADDIVLPAVTAAYIEARCRAGEPIEFRRVPGLDHAFAGLLSAPEVAAWIADRFAARPTFDECTPNG